MVNDMNGATFDVWATGSLLPGQDPVAAYGALAELFRRPQAEVETLFSSGPRRLRSGVDRATAERYVEALRRCGAQAHYQSEHLTLDDDVLPEPVRPAAAPVPAMHPSGSASAEAGASRQAERANSKLYAAFVGPANTAYYVDGFMAADRRGPGALRFNFAAAFFGWGWMAYRRMGLAAFLWFLLTAGVGLVLNLVSAGTRGSGQGALLLTALGSVLYLVVQGFVGPRLYWRRAQALAEDAHRRTGSPEAQLALLKAQGGTSAVVAWLLVGLLIGGMALTLLSVVLGQKRPALSGVGASTRSADVRADAGSEPAASPPRATYQQVDPQRVEPVSSLEWFRAAFRSLDSKNRTDLCVQDVLGLEYSPCQTSQAHWSGAPPYYELADGSLVMRESEEVYRTRFARLYPAAAADPRVREYIQQWEYRFRVDYPGWEPATKYYLAVAQVLDYLAMGKGLCKPTVRVGTGSASEREPWARFALRDEVLACERAK